MADFSISRPDLKGLLSLEKRVLAQRVMELHDELIRERARRDEVAVAEREACAALVEPTLPCPCDCGGRCYFQNPGELRDLTDWMTATAIATAIRTREA